MLDQSTSNLLSVTNRTLTVGCREACRQNYKMPVLPHAFVVAVSTDTQQGECEWKGIDFDDGVFPVRTISL